MLNSVLLTAYFLAEEVTCEWSEM